MSVDRAQIGATNRNKGAQAERDVARYLRGHGWPAAERKIDPGWRSRDRASADLGDIRCTPGLTWQVRYLRDMTDRVVEYSLTEAEEQATAAGTDYAILVQRRPGKADPGHWWAWVRVLDLAVLTFGPQITVRRREHHHPVRLQLAHLVDLLRINGYGTSE